MRNPMLKRLGIPLEAYQKQVRQALAPHRLELIRQREGWITRTENWIRSYFIPGSHVAIENITPTLELVTTEKQHELWRYCRLMGSIPYNRGCGRLLRYLLRDAGQPNRPIMGIIALSSPVLINAPRDRWIGWTYPQDVDLKRRRLLTCMELTVSMAIPPYSHLTAGKLICMAVLANEVRRDYREKFQDLETPTGLREGRLALISTTSLYGSSVQYNRIRVDGRKAYVCVGYTSGYGNAHVTESEFAEMERYLQDNGRQIPKGWGKGRSYRLRVLTAYHRHRHNQPEAPPHDHSRSVYVAPLARNCQSFLRDEHIELDGYDLPFEGLVRQWRDRWLAARLAKADVLTRFRTTDPASCFLSRELAAADLPTTTKT